MSEHEQDLLEVEIAALELILRALMPLDEAARLRVIRYHAARFGIPVSLAPARGRRG